MNINPVNINTNHNNRFGHLNPWSDSTYNTREKVIVAGTTALGVTAALCGLAKHAGYSLKPSKMFKNFKQSYIYKAPYDEPEVITVGAGSCLGGLAGGCIIDHSKENRKSKLRETLLQIANISVPIIFVGRLAAGGKYLGKRFLEKNPITETARTKIPKAIGAMIGLFTGVFCANILANKINEKIYHKGKGRDVQASDFSAHLDDFCMAARQIDAKNTIIHGFSMCVPLALMIAGNEVGNTTIYNESN